MQKEEILSSKSLVKDNGGRFNFQEFQIGRLLKLTKGLIFTIRFTAALIHSYIDTINHSIEKERDNRRY